MIAIEMLCISGFVCIHLFGGKLRFLDVTPRSRLLSFAGGTSVAYVFLHIFPELEETQQTLQTAGGVIPFIEHHAYFVSLIGLSLFYGLEVLLKKDQQQGDRENESSPGMFWLHIISFALYNGLVGYLLVHQGEENDQSMLMFFLAMALHFLVNDYGLRMDHKSSYHRVARWVLSLSLFAGWGLGRTVEIREMATGVLFALLAGGVILNVMKEELPEERKSRFLPFFCGVFLYSMLLLSI